MTNILVTGGAGYVGSILVPKLLDKNYQVTVLDKMWFGSHGIDYIKNDNLKIIKGDTRDKSLVDKISKNIDTVIHLAAVSNDPCSELDHNLTKEVNYDATVNLVQTAKKNGVQRFINISTASVYGIKDDPDVTEDLPLEPLTIYSKTKADAEIKIKECNNENFTTINLRPSTACGYSPRMRLDLVVNILSSHAIMNRKIIVFGGKQKRPNIHIQDITDLYLMMIDFPKEKVGGEAFNIAFENHTVMDLAEMIRDIIGEDVEIEVQPTDDPRSYHVSSEKIMRVAGFKPKRTIKDAVLEIKQAFEECKIKDWKDINYYNVKKMKAIQEML
jgi:nucleoside-diphosphate-sugar epimerase